MIDEIGRAMITKKVIEHIEDSIGCEASEEIKQAVYASQLHYRNLPSFMILPMLNLILFEAHERGMDIHFGKASDMMNIAPGSDTVN